MHTSPHRILNALLLACCASAVISGCAIQSPIWTDTDQLGPPTGAGSPTRQVQRCNMVQVSPWANTSGKWCEYAFKSNDGSLTTFGGLQTELANSLQQAGPLRPFLVAHRNSFHPIPPGRPQYQRYRLYLVGIRPSVVVGVPVAERESDECTAPGGSECMRFTEASEQARASRKLFGIYYSQRPPVREGAFVLVPEWRIESVALPTATPGQTLQHGKDVVTLANRDGTWQLAPK